MAHTIAELEALAATWKPGQTWACSQDGGRWHSTGSKHKPGWHWNTEYVMLIDENGKQINALACDGSKPQPA